MPVPDAPSATRAITSAPWVTSGSSPASLTMPASAQVGARGARGRSAKTGRSAAGQRDLDVSGAVARSSAGSQAARAPPPRRRLWSSRVGVAGKGASIMGQRLSRRAFADASGARMRRGNRLDRSRLAARADRACGREGNARFHDRPRTSTRRSEPLRGPAGGQGSLKSVAEILAREHTSADVGRADDGAEQAARASCASVAPGPSPASRMRSNIARTAPRRRPGN